MLRMRTTWQKIGLKSDFKIDNSEFCMKTQHFSVTVRISILDCSNLFTLCAQKSLKKLIIIITKALD